jgi:hypothetical protein
MSKFCELYTLTLYSSNSGQAIPSTFSHFGMAKTRNLKSNLSIRVVDSLKIVPSKIAFMENDDLLFNFSIEQSNFSLSQEQIHFVMKRRETPGLELYSETVDFETFDNGNGHYSAVLSLSELYKSTQVTSLDTWDSFIVINDPTGQSMTKGIVFPKNFTLNEHKSKLPNNTFSEASYQINKEGKFQINIHQKSIDVISEVIDIDEEENITLNVGVNDISQNIRVNRIYMRPRVYRKGDPIIFDLVELPIQTVEIKEKQVLKLKDIRITTNFNLASLLEGHRKEDKLVNDFYIELIDEITKSVSEVTIMTKNTKEFKKLFLKIDEYFTGTLYSTLSNSLALSIKKELQKTAGQKLKIGIFGSCFSRVAFTSTEFFNPDYKRKYQVVLNQWHTSIPSIMSKSVEFDETYFDHFTVGEANKVRRDFEKPFFQELSEIKPDYLLMDLYADATLDLLVIGEDQIITGSEQVKKSHRFLNSIKGQTKVITHKDINEFMKYWKPAAHRFVNELKKHYPEERVIFQKARMNSKYYDLKKNIRSYSNTLQELIKMTNYYYAIMEREILSLMPKARVIDINSYGYLGDQKFPFGHSSNHYETAYYREQLSQLDNIVIQDYIVNNEKIESLTSNII